MYKKKKYQIVKQALFRYKQKNYNIIKENKLMDLYF